MDDESKQPYQKPLYPVSNPFHSDPAKITFQRYGRESCIFAGVFNVWACWALQVLSLHRSQIPRPHRFARPHRYAKRCGRGEAMRAGNL
jgi:hypothetical protein